MQLLELKKNVEKITLKRAKNRLGNRTNVNYNLWTSYFDRRSREVARRGRTASWKVGKYQNLPTHNMCARTNAFEIDSRQLRMCQNFLGGRRRKHKAWRSWKIIKTSTLWHFYAQNPFAQLIDHQSINSIWLFPSLSVILLQPLKSQSRNWATRNYENRNAKNDLF